MESIIANFVVLKFGLLKKLFFIVIIFVISSSVFGQEEKIGEKEQIKLIYRSDVSGGAFLHSFGYGANFRYGQNLTARVKRTFSLELLNMKHPKEKKVFSNLQDDARGYYFGKLNSLTILRANIGRQKVIYGKELKGGVQVNYSYSIGPTLGFLKPIYLEVSDQFTGRINIEKYDPDDQQLIFGRALFTYGLNEISLLPGGHAKFALNFEYAPDDELLKAIEVGAVVDGFAREPEIMAKTSNNQFWLTFYVNIQFGKKIL